MYQGKHMNKAATRGTPKRHRRLRWRKEFVLVCSVLVLLIGMIGGTLAYLIAGTDPVTNTFTAANPGIEIEETFNKETKENVKVVNDSDYSVYARATYVAYWVSDAEGTSGQVLAEAPQLTDEQIGASWGNQHEDGYWYYSKVLDAKKPSDPFIVKISADKKDNCHLVVDVIMETVQAEPEQAVIDVWGFKPTEN